MRACWTARSTSTLRARPRATALHLEPHVGLEANIELYQPMQLILADNALARERSAEPRAVPRLRACFHVACTTSSTNPEGLNPTSFSYLVGQVTIELARMIDKALPGQILVGKFDTVMRDDVTGEEERIDSLDFVDRAARVAAPAQWAQPGRLRG